MLNLLQFNPTKSKKKYSILIFIDTRFEEVMQ